MNSKMTINSQLSTTEPKKQKQIKQTPEEEHTTAYYHEVTQD